MKRVRLDFNSIREDGSFRVTNSAADEPLVEFEAIVCEDPDEIDLIYMGRVIRSEGPGVFSVEVNWDSHLTNDSLFKK